MFEREKEANMKVFAKSGNMSIFSLENMQESKMVIYVHNVVDMADNHTKFQLNWFTTYFQLKLFDTWNIVKVSESGMKRWSSMCSTILQSFIFITFIASQKIATSIFLTRPDTEPVDWPNFDYYILTFFLMRVNNTSPDFTVVHR